MTLKEALDKAVKKEDYERAAKLRDRIKKYGENAVAAFAEDPVKSSTWKMNNGTIVAPRTLYPERRVSVSDEAKSNTPKLPSRRRTRPVRELMSERKAAVQEELGARLAAIQDMSGERVYRWDVIRIADMRNYYEEFILDGVCILRVQHFDERFYL